VWSAEKRADSWSPWHPAFCRGPKVRGSEVGLQGSGCGVLFGGWGLGLRFPWYMTSYTTEASTLPKAICRSDGEGFRVQGSGSKSQGSGFSFETRDGLCEGCRESRTCSRDTYPELYITKYTSVRIETFRVGCGRPPRQGWEATKFWYQKCPVSILAKLTSSSSVLLSSLELSDTKVYEP